MKKYLTTLTSLLFLLYPLSALYPDEFYLKNGQTLDGKIIYQDDELIIISNPKWGKTKISKKEIQKIIPKSTPQEEYKQRFYKLFYNDVEGFYKLGLFAKEHNLLKEAKQCFYRVIYFAPHHKGARKELGYVLYKGKWIHSSKLPSQTSTEQKPLHNLTPPPDTPVVAIKYLKKGDQYLQEAKRNPTQTRNKLKKAITYYKLARNIAPNLALASYKLGIVYQMTYQFLYAKDALKRAIRLNKNFYEAMVELGDTYAWMKNYTRAFEYYQKSIELYDKYPQAYISRGLLFTKTHQFQKAKHDFETSLKLNPNHLQAKYYLAMINKELKGTGWKKKYTLKSKNYIAYTNISQEYAKKILKHAELIHRLYTKIFPPVKKPKGLFPIYIFKTRMGYLSAGAPKGSAGYFHPILQKLVFYQQKNLDTTLNVLYHEAFHQYIHYYSPYVPSWFNEGHGDFFGGCRYSKSKNGMEILPNRWRLHKIKSAIQRGKYTPLSKLLQMSKAELYSNASLHYAQAWSVVYFLWMYQQGKYRRLVGKYFKLIKEGYGRIEAYEKTFGKVDLKLLEQEWKTFTLSLSLPKTKTNK